MEVVIAKAGRPKGSMTKTNQKTRAAIASFFDNHFTLKELERLISKVEEQEGAKAALQCYTALLDYTLPKLQRVEHTGKDGDSLKIEHILNDLSTDKNSMLPMPEDDNVIDVIAEESVLDSD